MFLLLLPFFFAMIVTGDEMECAQQDNGMCAVLLYLDTKRPPAGHKMNGVQCA